MGMIRQCTTPINQLCSYGPCFVMYCLSSSSIPLLSLAYVRVHLDSISSSSTTSLLVFISQLHFVAVPRWGLIKLCTTPVNLLGSYGSVLYYVLPLFLIHPPLSALARVRVHLGSISNSSTTSLLIFNSPLPSCALMGLIRQCTTPVNVLCSYG